VTAEVGTAGRNERDLKLARRISNAVVALSALLVGANVVVSFTQPPLTNQDQTDWLFNIIIVVGFSIYAAIGCLIVRRQPRNAIGWLLLFVPLIGSLTLANGVYTDTALVRAPGSLPFGTIGAWLDRWLLVLALAAFIPIFLLFPDGRLPSRSRIWRIVGWITFAAPVVTTLAFALTPGRLTGALTHIEHLHVMNPVGVGSRDTMNAITQIGGMTMLATGIAGFVGLIVRYRRATPEVRQQIRWLALVGAAFLAVLVVGISLSVVAPALMDGAVGTLFFVLAFTILVIGIPAACGIAILKYRLYDLDVVIRKTVVFTVLAVFIAGVYALIVVGVGALIGSRSNTTLAFAAAAVLAIAFQPVREWARRFADRLVYGRRATPYEVLSEFSGRMGETYATEDVLPRMAQILAEGTGASGARVLLGTGSRMHEGARWPADARPDDGEHVVAVVDRGEELGALAVTMPANDPMNPAKDKLVRDLASQAGLVLRNARLIEELRASRRRIVSAQDERARKLERDIHDGAQQQLVALGVKMRLLEPMLDRDLAKARELLDQLRDDTTDALDTLRDLARGIYPPILADQGLPAALEAQGRKAVVPVVLEPDGVGRYPQDVESAVYFCVLEALQNVGKYANASAVNVRLLEDDGNLVFEVRDDGVGFDPDSARDGTGLRGMADRLEAVGGQLHVSSALGEGSTIGGRVPVGGR
jgi:signal transduction histidine kinase